MKTVLSLTFVAPLVGHTGLAGSRTGYTCPAKDASNSERPRRSRALMRVGAALTALTAFTSFPLGGLCAPVSAAEVTETELMQAAVELGRQYDANYAKKDPAGMAALYAEDGVLVSPGGPIVRGRDALRSYYTKRFASGARSHAIKVVEVHVQGDGGYGLSQFSVTVPRNDGSFREERGSIVTIYQRGPDGWHLRLVIPSVPERAG
jgi:uncharacterized protein (TIGR02246 family)